jgi:hypothetical protein
MKKSTTFYNSWWLAGGSVFLGIGNIGLSVSSGEFTMDEWRVVMGAIFLLLGGLRAGMLLGAKKSK